MKEAHFSLKIKTCGVRKVRIGVVAHWSYISRFSVSAYPTIFSTRLPYSRSLMVWDGFWSSSHLVCFPSSKKDEGKRAGKALQEAPPRLLLISEWLLVSAREIGSVVLDTLFRIWKERITWDSVAEMPKWSQSDLWFPSSFSNRITAIPVYH